MELQLCASESPPFMGISKNVADASKGFNQCDLEFDAVEQFFDSALRAASHAVVLFCRRATWL